MKTNTIMKRFGAMALLLGLVVGCASTPEPKGPSEEQLAAEAISAAQAVIDEAAAIGADTSTAEQLLADARAAFEKGEYASALRLANQAAQAARDAIAKKRAEGATTAPADSSYSTYSVVNGDNLWNIAGSSAGYGNPYQWPLIYKANKDQIKDADLIYPGQSLRIESSPSSADINAAVNHAKTRGAWSIGASEASDQAYLSQ